MEEISTKDDPSSTLESNPVHGGRRLGKPARGHERKLSGMQSKTLSITSFDAHAQRIQESRKNRSRKSVFHQSQWTDIWCKASRRGLAHDTAFAGEVTKADTGKWWGHRKRHHTVSHNLHRAYAAQGQKVPWSAVKIVLFLCFSYFVLKTAQPLMLGWTKEGGEYPYIPSSSLWFSRVLLSVFFVCMVYYAGESLSADHWKLSVYYIPVSFLATTYVFCIYLSIDYLGAGTYAVLRNFYVVVTAILFRLILKKPLTASQWGNVLIITLALVIYKSDAFSSDSDPVGYIFLLGLVLSSSLNGVLLQWVHKEIESQKKCTFSFFQQSFFYHFYSSWFGFLLMITYDYKTVWLEGGAGPFTVDIQGGGVFCRHTAVGDRQACVHGDSECYGGKANYEWNDNFSVHPQHLHL